jgi:hypothetical protein
MSTGSTLTSVQAWFRDHSRNLENSFKSSKRIKHNVSKGESRENQIFDTLSHLLPTRVSVEMKPVIVDIEDQQSPSFDGAFIDRISWPRIFTTDGTLVAMIESVLAAVEVKSSLDKSGLDNIFNKSNRLRSMICNDGNPTKIRPLVTAFAYECPNLNLSFFDFATSFAYAPDYSPSLICILNRGLFGLAEIVAGKSVPLDEPHSGATPILYQPGEDSLLVYLYFLSCWAGIGTTAAQTFRQYSISLFSSMTGFHFDVDFISAVAMNETARNTARKCFLRKASSDIKDLYKAARDAISLPVT